MENFRMNMVGPLASQPVRQGVDSLFSDFNCRTTPLDLDFAAEELLLGGSFADPQEEAYHRNAALTNIASQGAAIRSVVTTGFSGCAQPAWKAWSPSDDPRMDVEQSSADSLPSTSYQPSGSPLPQLQEIKVESAAPARQGLSQPPRMSARQAAQLEKDRERAEKLKEKNKRAQRKFRQRQKDRQESAEKMAMDLAEQLRKMQLEKEALENRNRALEDALSNAPASSAMAVQQEEAEPTFTPAKGWDVFNPTGGLVLVAICNPPRKFTHRQVMSLSLRDMSKIMGELVRLLKECLEALDRESPNPTAEARIQALLWERHALMAYLAVNSPLMCYRVLTSKMVDPPEPNCSPPPSTLWAKVLRSIEMTEQRKQNVMDARNLYMKKIGKALLERHDLRKRMQELELIPSTSGAGRVPTLHLEWSEVVGKLKANLELCHRCHSYFMARVWYRDCFTPAQVARFICEAHPYPVDIFAVIKELAEQLGAPSYKEVLESQCGKERMAQASSALDAYCEDWPATMLSKEGRESYLTQQRERAGSPDPEVAKFSHRIPNDESVTS